MERKNNNFIVFCIIILTLQEIYVTKFNSVNQISIHSVEYFYISFLFHIFSNQIRVRNLIY